MERNDMEEFQRGLVGGGRVGLIWDVRLNEDVIT